MTIHLGDVSAGSTLYIPFTTYDKTNGASVTMTGLATTDIEIYKNGSTTQRASDTGYALLDTDGIDFDSITGLHGFSIDLADNTDAGFFAVGSFYWVVVSTITIDSQTVTFIPATFRIVAAENTAGYPVADAAKLGGTTVTGRDIGASVLLSSGTGTGQLDFTSGVVKANLAQILGTALTETSGLIAAAFKKFFNVATPTGTVNSLADAVPGAAGGGFIAGTNAATTITTALTTTFTGDLTGSVGTVAANGITATSMAADAINAAAIKTGAITNAKFAAGAIDAAAIAAGAIDNATFAADVGSTAYATNIIALAVDKALGNYDPPTNTEFEARTIAAADYVVVGDTIAAVTSVTNGVTLADDAITAAKYDESTAFPLKAADSGATYVARTGADSDTLKTLSDQLDAVESGIGNIVSVGSPSYAAPSSYTLTTGTQTGGTYANVDSDNDTYHVHTDDAGTLSLIYDWTLATDEQANSVIWRGRWNGTNDTLLFELYDWVAPGWVTWFTRIGVSGTTSAADWTQEASLVSKYTGTGVNAGKLRVRITGTGLSSMTLSTDLLIVGKTTRAGGIANGSTVTLAATTTNQNYVGNNWILALGGQDISGSYFYGAKQVTGVSSASTGVTFENCDFGAATVPPGKYINCGFGLASGTLTAALAGEYILRSCYSCVPGSGTPAFDWATGSGTIRINGRGWHGGSSHTIDGDNTISWEVNGGGGQTFDGGGTIELRGNFRQATITNHAAGKTSQIASSGCGPIAINGAGGTVNIFGLTGTITDNSGGAVTITSAQVVNLANVNAEVDSALNTAIPGSPTADSINERIVTMDAGVNVSGISGDTTAADRLEAILDASPTGAVVDDNDPDPTTLLFETNLAEATTDHYKGAFVVFYSGALLGQSRKISAYDGTTKVLTVLAAFTEAPAAGDTFMILGRSE